MKPRIYLLFVLLLARLGTYASVGRCATPPPRTPTQDERYVAKALEFPANPSAEDILAARVFEEPLVPVGSSAGAAENAALATAIVEYVRRTAPDNFSSLTQFLEKHPQSAWSAALWTSLGLEYYKTAYYSLALDAWRQAWALGQKATNAQGKFLADRAVCELAGLYSRLGRMNELEALLKSVEGRVFIGGATERISLAREALWMMQNQPGVSFRCGPLALQSIKRSLDPETPADMAIFNSVSTQQGFSLAQVAALSKEVGLNYQMAFRLSPSPSPQGGVRGDLIVPSVVHWKVGHYAALVRQVGDRYLLEDPTFGNTVWATRESLAAETSGYFLIPPGDLPRGWRSVDAKEGDAIRGKGVTSGSDPNVYTPDDLQTGQCGLDGPGMAVSRVHLMLANLQIKDTPVGYTPPVGPPVRFTVRYNYRNFQGFGVQSVLLGPNWTHDWDGRITDSPNNPLADVTYLVAGGGARTFTGFNTNTQTFAPQQYDQTQLKRITNYTYEMTYPDGSKKLFGQRWGLNAALLTQVVDPDGNAVTLTYDFGGIGGIPRLLAVTDAIGQVTTIAYEHPANSDLITKVTDPFGRSARFQYDAQLILIQVNPQVFTTIHFLTNIIDVVGLSSRFEYFSGGSSMQRMITPYGPTVFSVGQGPSSNATMRFVETLYPDGSKERVEFNQSANLGTPFSDPVSSVPKGMAIDNRYLHGRNTYYWSRTACASAYGDHTKAKIYHWLHLTDITKCSGILESTKQPLEGRVWYNYAGQGSPLLVGKTDLRTRVGRVLDDSTTQLYTYGYNDFGKMTNRVDPLGRTFSYVYATNGVDLLEVRMTRAGNNELLFQATYNSRHRPQTVIDAAGQTNTFTYNARGQLLTTTNPKGETITYSYDANGYLVTADGPLPGPNDTARITYDSFGRIRTMTDVSGDTLIFEYDALDRIVRVTHPDSSFTQYTYDRLDLVNIRDRRNRHTLLEYDNVGQIKRKTDPLGRETLFSWCRCGAIKGLTDPMGRTTEWHTDVQGRLTSKQFADGSQVSYFYENASSRLREIVDEKGQRTRFAYNRDDTVHSKSYANTTVATPAATYTYDTNYERVISMTDGTGTTLYSYNPIVGTPGLGAGRLARVDGPLPNDTITYAYDELGRPLQRAIDGVSLAMTYDAAGRLVGVTNALGTFVYGYDGSSHRLISQTLPNGQTKELGYGGNLQDRMLQRITHRIGVTPISEFVYGRDVPADRITTWSQQAGAQSPFLHSFGYDAADQLLSVTVTNSGALVNTFGYTYDPVGNRLTEQIGPANYIAGYNALNQISASTAPGSSRTNEWDAADRLAAVQAGNQRTEFTYDGQSRVVGIRHLLNGSEVWHRRLVWCGGEICEERDAFGAVTKRFFPQGLKVETGPATGAFFYTRDHLGSIRELTDGSGRVRARYAYDPYGRRTRLTGDVEADFGFAGMFWAPEVNLSLTHYRAYDPELGRWLSRDPLRGAELKQGPNLYAYVGNGPINRIDPEGLICAGTPCLCGREPGLCAALAGTGAAGGGAAVNELEAAAPALENSLIACADTLPALEAASPQIEAELLSLEARMVDLAARFKDLPSSEIQRAYNSGKYYGEILEIDVEFQNIVMGLVERWQLWRGPADNGATLFDKAWQTAVRVMGFDPDTWMP